CGPSGPGWSRRPARMRTPPSWWSCWMNSRSSRTSPAAYRRAAVALDRARREEEAELDVPAGRRGSGVAGEIALARRESGSRGRQLLSLATFLDRELPHTRARLAEGTLSEYRASLLAKEMACLDRPDRMTVDEQLCGAPARLNGMGTRALVAAAKKAAAEIDVKAVVTRARQAESDRRVTL